MTTAQRAALFAEPELVDLAELPEYEPLIGRLVRRTRPADIRGKIILQRRARKP